MEVNVEVLFHDVSVAVLLMVVLAVGVDIVVVGIVVGVDFLVDGIVVGVDAVVVVVLLSVVVDVSVEPVSAAKKIVLIILSFFEVAKISKNI